MVRGVQERISPPISSHSILGTVMNPMPLHSFIPSHEFAPSLAHSLVPLHSLIPWHCTKSSRSRVFSLLPEQPWAAKSPSTAVATTSPFVFVLVMGLVSSCPLTSGWVLGSGTRRPSAWLRASNTFSSEPLPKAAPSPGGSTSRGRRREASALQRPPGFALAGVPGLRAGFPSVDENERRAHRIFRRWLGSLGAPVRPSLVPSVRASPRLSGQPGPAPSTHTPSLLPHTRFFFLTRDQLSDPDLPFTRPSVHGFAVLGDRRRGWRFGLRQGESILASLPSKMSSVSFVRGPLARDRPRVRDLPKGE